ncbi:LAMC3 protein, partial [Amia calva]|nr:LAMC3 protein [Amia calva]
MDKVMLWLLVLKLHSSSVSGAMDSCYESQGAASRCMPKFENAAFNRTVMVSNVCGSPPEDFCTQTGSTRSCHRCDSTDPHLHHNATYLSDFHNDEESTWWQSQSMFYGVQYPNSVNITLHLGKAYEITYVRLKFHTSRPESFAIYKRTREDGPWLPYQYYSASCRKTYGQTNKGYLRPGDNERLATCTDEFSDISPLTGGNVAFSTLEGRPSAYNYDQSPLLQEWVTATDLLISLNRLNTFGDEFFKDPQVLRSYYYAISDFSVGGRCKCNGHASECVSDEMGRLVCDCQHNTWGPDCEKCQPFYHDRPWARATADSANECLRCNCSRRSEECFFDAELYRSTGHGGYCENCRDGTAGPHCERCEDNFYRSDPRDVCLPCNCNVLGSRSVQCGGDGRCVCKASVTGEKCDSCQPGYHSLTASGCRACECHSEGSVSVCNPQDGQCRCKANVEGYLCDRCKPGSFNLGTGNVDGCLACFCYGHSAVCSSSLHYSAVNITSDFIEDTDGWTGVFATGLEFPLIWKEGEVYLLPYSEDDIGFYKAPEKFLGNKLLSYGQPLSFTFQAESWELLPQSVTVVLQGSGLTISALLSPLQGEEPSSVLQHTFVLRLQEREEGQQPVLSSFDYHRLLSNLTAIKISNAGGQNYTSQLSGVTLLSAAPSLWTSAPWVEECVCPQGYAGEFCERCASGYKREIPNGGPFTRCLPCTCNQHGTCDPETGVCHCTDNTAGDACNSCLDGYYGNPSVGHAGDCAPCPCPEQSSCAEVPGTGEVVCTDCPPGRRGTRCELCDDGFYGDPRGQYGAVQPCVACQCSGNVDSNALGVCDHVTGRCLKCLYHTEGVHCQRCQEGYYGNALDPDPGNKCRPCSCSPSGSVVSAQGCDPQTGQCQCLSHVMGRDCSQCERGFFNLRPRVGCERCNCSTTGAVSPACHPITGRCTCRPGVEGTGCDSCRKGFFNFSPRGCRACNCNPMGSVTMQCHDNATCVCREGFVGYKCDQCELNFFHNRRTHQCEECPVCYSLVRDEAAKLKAGLQALEKRLQGYDCRNRHGYKNNLIQGEGAWTNALEDLLAIQDARKAFVKEFKELEESVGRVQAGLSTTTLTLNCSREESAGVCRILADTSSATRSAQRQLQEAAQTLASMISHLLIFQVIPFEAPAGPNQWTVMVKEFRTLAVGHKEVGDYIESIAQKAFTASNQTYALLHAFLENNSTETHIRSLAEQFLEMHQAKDNLTLSVNEMLTEANKTYVSVQKTHSEMAQVLLNLTAFQQEITPETNFTITDLQLENIFIVFICMLTCLLWAARVREAKSTAESSVVKGKEVEAEASALVKELEDMKKTWPRKTAQIKASVKKGKIVKEKILSDSKKKTKQGEKIIRPALDNSTLANATATEAESMASGATKGARGVLSQAREARGDSLHLNFTANAILHKLTDQEGRTAQLSREMGEIEEVADTAGDAKDNIETAKRYLEQYALILSELLDDIEENKADEQLDRILNETATQLGALRRRVESQSLDEKIRALQEAARQQQSELTAVDKDIVEILVEKTSLEDIALNLPEGCMDGPKTGRL